MTLLEQQSTLRRVLLVAWPVMLSYVAVGLACGVLEGKVGMEPWMAFVLGATYLSGAGQFMMSNLWLAGVPMGSILASIAAISVRFALYSASLAPHLSRAPRALSLGVSATLTEEAYGISLAKLVEGKGWTPLHALMLNVSLLLTWGASCALGAAIGAAVDIPTAIAGFAMTSLFIYLLTTQPFTRGGVVAAVVAVIVVATCKYLSAASIAVPLAAVAGVVSALLVGALLPQGGAQ